MEFIISVLILLFLLVYNQIIDTKSFIESVSPFVKKLMEEDYEFLLRIKYEGKELDIEQLFFMRIRNGILVTFAILFVLLFMGQLNYIYAILAVVGGFLTFKSGYTNLKSAYKKRLHYIDQLLPYYLKSLEILVQHYTVPVALGRSIETAPDIFKPGLRKLVARIDEGDASVQPYVDFAKEYPVRDSMRMMRLLYRLGLGSQQDKHEQVMMFSRTVSTLQNKAREQKYEARLEAMEKRTMVMLFATGGGIIMVLFMSMAVMMGI